MSESDFEVIVVGAGLAGSVAAYELAKLGKSVLVVERGNFAGAKNMTGGRIYVHSLRNVFTDEELAEAPFERKIVHERISLMAPDANFTIDFSSGEMSKPEQASYSVLHATFDAWLAEKAEEAGAEMIYGIPVEGLLKDETGKVCGVRAGEDEITADIVILADGANSLLAKEAVGYEKPPASQMAVSVKEVFDLPAGTITDRILANSDDEGAAWLFAGDATHGTFGGGFMYTNKESISLGVVAGIEACANGGVPVYQMLEDLKNHPAVAPLIRGAKVMEHSGHMVPEGGLNIMPQLVNDGVMLAGDSAMMCINLGYMVRGMDYAVAAGQMAGRHAAVALEVGDTSKAALQGYVEDLENSFVMKDFRQYQGEPAFLENFDRMFSGYPEMVRDIMNEMFVVDGSPVTPLKKKVMPHVKKVGIMNIARDVRGAMKAL
ncbi:MAG: FAD-dependent oxidoreductase [Eggerthellaceae bacterium]|nr:FAD-dependent oxidoreductase [Eggerthellaceae bacterium]